jgi:hypothetical protein
MLSFDPGLFLTDRAEFCVVESAALPVFSLTVTMRELSPAMFRPLSDIFVGGCFGSGLNRSEFAGGPNS